MSDHRERAASAIGDWLAATKSRGPSKYWYPLNAATYGVDEIFEALDSLCEQRTTMGEKVAEFERAFAEYVGCRNAIMVNSGSSADLLLSFLLASPPAPRLLPGDEVLVPAVTWPTQVWSPMMAGLRVKLVDVDPATMNVSVDALRRAIGPRTRAMFLVHLMGNPCDMDAIGALAAEHNLAVLEDCCESLGAEWRGRKVGVFGIGGAFSFFFSHHITTMEGGMVVTDDDEAADRIRLLRAHGWMRNLKSPPTTVSHDVDTRYTFLNWGFNVRPTDLQGGFGIHQLRRIAGFTARRDALAKRFHEFIDSQPTLARPKVLDGARPIWMSFPLLVAVDAPFTRADLVAHLEANGVETRPVVTGNLARQPATRLFDTLDASGELPGAERIHRDGFYIGVHPMVTDAEMTRLIEVFDEFLARMRT